MRVELFFCNIFPKLIFTSSLSKYYILILTHRNDQTNNAIMLGFIFTRARACTCSKQGYGELDSSKMAFGRVRLATCRVRLDRLIGPEFMTVSH